MADEIVYFSGSRAQCEGVERLAKEDGRMTSGISPANSASEPLNAPLAGAEIIIALKVIAAAFSAASAAIDFIKRVRSGLQADEAVDVTKGKLPAPLRLTRETRDADIENYFST